MKVIPAIDIYNGKVVRLHKGKYEDMKVYYENPIEIFKKFKEKGFSRVHIVDLEGAKYGVPKNMDVIEKLVEWKESVEIEVGGGIRDIEVVKKLVGIGVDFVIIGTKAVEDPKFLKILLENFRDRIIVGVDAENMRLKIRGWIDYADMDVIRFVRDLESLGAKQIVYTNISKDGTLTGPDFLGLEKILEATNKLGVILSGGVSGEMDLKNARDLAEKVGDRFVGIIVGKALYENKVTMEVMKKYDG